MGKTIKLDPDRKSPWRGGRLIPLIVIFLAVAGYILYRSFGRSAGHFMRLRQYWEDPEKQEMWGLKISERCGEAPFLMPTTGFVAFFWGDRYRAGRRHQGIDIFSPLGPDKVGETPVVAAYDGYLTRLENWRSAVIIRIPLDPLEPKRQIWTYYTHMADAEGRTLIDPRFPPGTSDEFVRAGELLGYQGNYSADPDNPTGVHLHFSIVKDDGEGEFLNELEIRNTLDPSPYFGVELNAERIGSDVARCMHTS